MYHSYQSFISRSVLGCRNRHNVVRAGGSAGQGLNNNLLRSRSSCISFLRGCRNNLRRHPRSLGCCNNLCWCHPHSRSHLRIHTVDTMHMERQLEKRRPVPSSLGCGGVKIPQVEGIGVLISYPCHAVYAKMATVLKQLYCWTVCLSVCRSVGLSVHL